MMKSQPRVFNTAPTMLYSSFAPHFSGLPSPTFYPVTLTLSTMEPIVYNPHVCPCYQSSPDYTILIVLVCLMLVVAFYFYRRGPLFHYSQLVTTEQKLPRGPSTKIQAEVRY